MFGLMKPVGCSHGRSAESAKHRRLHYCGTCKTMGRQYGQRARMLLNNDAVFLAELLTDLGPDRGSVSTWARQYQSFNCASLPAGDSEMPAALQFAAAATLVMSEMKLQDHVEDSSRSGLKMIGRIYSEGFAKAAARLRDCGVNVDELWGWYRAQHDREMDVLEPRHGSLPGGSDALNLLAEPTGCITGSVFQSGARAVGANESAQASMREIGDKFGRLIYLLDAFEDDAKDAKSGEFNAFQAAYGMSGSRLESDARDLAATVIQAASASAAAAIEALPIASERKAMYTARLHANVARKLGLPEVSCCHSVQSTPRHTRWQIARAAAHRLTEQHRAECAGILGTLKTPLVYAVVLITALVLPRQAMTAASYREFVGILFNLMFWGAAFNAVLAMPQRLAAGSRLMYAMDGGIPHSSSGGKHHTTVVTTTRIRRRPCCNCCECDCCCDGCCTSCAESCACDCCTCEACECATCACDACSGCS